MTVADVVTAYALACVGLVPEPRALGRCVRALILLHHPSRWATA